MAREGLGGTLAEARAQVGQRLARLCFAKNDATLEAAIDRLEKL